MNELKDVVFNFAGAFVGAVGVASDLNVVQWVSAISALVMAGIALVRAAISTVETVRKWKAGKIDAEQAKKELDDVLDDLEKGGKGHD